MAKRKAKTKAVRPPMFDAQSADKFAAELQRLLGRNFLVFKEYIQPVGDRAPAPYVKVMAGDSTVRTIWRACEPIEVAGLCRARAGRPEDRA